jgi:hypothetical protein
VYIIVMSCAEIRSRSIAVGRAVLILTRGSSAYTLNGLGEGSIYDKRDKESEREAQKDTDTKRERQRGRQTDKQTETERQREYTFSGVQVQRFPSPGEGDLNSPIASTTLVNEEVARRMMVVTADLQSCLVFDGHGEDIVLGV